MIRQTNFFVRNHLRSAVLRYPQMAGLALVALLASGGVLAEMETAERRERQMDRAALAAQDQAIATLQALAKKYSGTERELAVLTKLVEAHQDAAKIEFRLSHADIGGDGLTKAQLARYHQRLNNVVNSVASLVAIFPDEDGVEPTYLVRAEAYNELNEKALARKDYEYVSAQFPKSPSAVRANVALGNLANEAGDYRRTIASLSKIDTKSSPHLPFVLHQIAWAHFNLEEVPTAISQLKLRNEYYRKKEAETGEGKLSNSDRALKEQGLRDLTSFYFSRFDKGDKNFPLKGALAAFRDAEPGPARGKMWVHLAGLLRTRERLEALTQWTDLVIEEESGLPEALDVIVVNFEHVLEKDLLDRVQTMTKTLQKLDEKTHRKIRDLPTYSKALNLVLKSATSLQNRMGKETSPEKIAAARKEVSVIYSAFLGLTSDSHPAYLLVRYNLAEIHFAGQQFEAALEEYNWLLLHGGEKLPINMATLNLKTISVGYRLLDKENLIPKNLSPEKLDAIAAPNVASLPAKQKSWVAKLHAHIERYGREPEGFEEFEFESNRILYANGQRLAALDGLRRMVKSKPRSNVALPAAKLMLDTYLVSENWAGARDVAEEFKAIPNFGDAAFQGHLTEIPAQANIQMAQQASASGDFGKAASLSQDLLRKYPNSKWAPDALLLAGRAAMSKGDLVRARQLFADLLARFPNADNRGVVLQLQAGLAEDELDFDSAARTLRVIFSAPQSGANREERSRQASRFFLASWLSIRPQPLDCAQFREPAALANECDRFRALMALATDGGGTNPTEALEKAVNGPEEARPIWSAVALEIGMSKLSLKDRLSLAKILGTGWKRLDPMIQFALIASLNRTIPEALRLTYEALPRVAPLKANSQSLVKRIGLVRDVETTAEAIVDLPWAQTKLSLLATIAQIYEDFCVELAKLPTPKNLTPEELTQYQAGVAEILTPFRAKGETLRSQVRTSAAKSAVDPRLVAGMDGTTSRKPASSMAPEANLLRALMDEIRRIPNNGDSKLGPEKLANLWEQALKEERWERNGYLFQELKEKFKIRTAISSAMQALTLARAGAKSEALAELEGSRSGLDPSQQRLAALVLASWYESSTVPDKATGRTSDLNQRGKQP